MEKLIQVAVYDALRMDGSENLIYLDEAEYQGIYYTEPIYDLYSTSKNYAGLVKNGNTSVLLEIYTIDENILLHLDYFHGLATTSYMSPYTKETIKTSYGECTIYMYDRPTIGKPKIDSGDYISWKENLKKMIKQQEEKEFSSRHSIE